MDENMLTDITLDHLPDLSDASVSFQIPANEADADLLLADHTGSFDLLCRASDSDASFAPVSPRRPRGPTLTLSELTPRVYPSHKPPSSRSPTPTALAVPNVSLTLERCSPRKRHPSPSSTRDVACPLVSEERLDHLRAQVETLRQADDASHAFPDNPTPSSPISKLGMDARPSEDPPGEERETGLGCKISVTQDVVMVNDNAPADATDIALPTPRPNVSRNPRTTAKPTVATGGISKRAPFPTTRVSKKTKNKPSRTREAHNVPLARQPGPQQPIAIDAVQALVPPAKPSGDIDTKSENTQITHPGTGGLAERLVSYSQRLISSIGLYKPYSESSSAEASNDAVKVEDAPTETRTPAAAPAPSPPHETMLDTRHAPFRLSEISPHKPLDAPQPNSPGHTGNQRDGRSAVSPIRPAKKRASTDTDLVSDGHLRKKGKTMAADAEGRGFSDPEADSQDQTQGQGQHEEVTHSPPTRHIESTMPNARTKYKPRLGLSSRCKGPTLDPFPYLSRSRQVRRSWIKGKRSEGPLNTARSGSVQSAQRDEGTRDENVVRSCQAHAREPFGVCDLPLIEKKQNATLCAPLTKPVGFTFRVDARLEARKEERLTASEPGQVLPRHCEPKPPRFASLHGRPPSLASVPVAPFYFCTEQRAKERERFDAMVRHKEEEAERAKEAMRRQEAEAEEREIRELRRRAVPKANAIPEWYADMPKRRPV